MLLQRVLVVLISVLAFGSPYILFLTANDRLVPHVRTSLWQGTSLVGASQSPETTFDIDLSQPLLRWMNDEVRVDTRINIRWAEEVSDLARPAKEEVHELREGEDTGDRTWRYVIDHDISAQRLRALVADPGVEDTQGIDRETFRIERPGFRMPVEIGPGLLTEGNATLWLYYATASLPPLSLLLLGMKRIGWLSWRSAMPRESLKILTAAAYCLLLNRALIRGSLDSRLADVSTSTAVLAAWVNGTGARARGGAGRMGAAARRVAAGRRESKVEGGNFASIAGTRHAGDRGAGCRDPVELHDVRAIRAKVPGDRYSEGTDAGLAKSPRDRG